MPNFDGRGPRWGSGSFGRGAGPCGRGSFFGFGRRAVQRGSNSKSDLELLKEDEKALEDELALVREEIKELAKN